MCRTAVITIEVLIALVILFSAIVLTTASVKSLNNFTMKKKVYNDHFVTALSLKALLENRKFENAESTFEGELNGYSYKVTCTHRMSKGETLVSEFETMRETTGLYTFSLYECSMLLDDQKHTKEYIFETLKVSKSI